MVPVTTPTWKQHLAWQKLQDLETEYLLFGGGTGRGKSWLGREWLLQSTSRKKPRNEDKVVDHEFNESITLTGRELKLIDEIKLKIGGQKLIEELKTITDKLNAK